MVEKLFEEMAYLDMPIQESIIISVINCCRPSVRAPIRSTSSSNQVGATDEWAKALWIVNRWAGKVECLTESLYTIAMDVCFEAGKYKQVIDLYFNVLPRHYTGSTKSSLSFALKACEKMKDADTALLLLKSALEKGLCTNSMSGSVIVFCTSLGRLDVALQAFLAAYADELEDETKFMPLTNTRRFARDLLNYFATSSPNGSFKSLSPKSEEQLFQGLFRIVVSTFRGNKMVLENDDYERFITLLLKRKDLASLRTFISKSLNTPLSRNSQPMYEHMVQSLFLNIEPILAVELILSISEELHNAMRSRSANAIILHTMGFIYNNLTSSQLEGGLVENFVPTIGSTDRHQDKEESSRHRKYAPCVKERLVWRIFQKGRAMNGGKENLPIRCYRIAALACRDADLTQEMFELYMYSKQVPFIGFI